MSEKSGPSFYRSEMNDHMTVSTSDRGFKSLPKVIGLHGDDIQVYESSNAEEACVWVSIEGPDGKHASLQLPIVAAATVARQLDLLVANHYQLPSEADDAG